MAIIGIAGMDDVVRKIKDEKVSIGVVIAVAVLAYYAHGWVFETFVTKANAQENVAGVQKTLDDVQHTLNSFVQNYEIREAKKNVETIEATMFHMQQHVAEHGNTPETEAKISSLQRRLDNAVKYRDCLLNDHPNCEHLKG